MGRDAPKRAPIENPNDERRSVPVAVSHLEGAGCSSPAFLIDLTVVVVRSDFRHRDAGKDLPTMHDTHDDGTDRIVDYVSKNRELLSRVLARGDREAQAYALAAISRGGNPRDIDDIQQLLEEMKTGGE